MDTPLFNRIFRQLTAHRSCQTCCQHLRRQQTRVPVTQQSPKRLIHSSPRTTRSRDSDLKNETVWRQRMDRFPHDRLDEYRRYPMVDSYQVRSRTERPRRVKMLLRDFIEDSLYNPSYGYFSKQAVIFSPGEPFDFRALENEEAFHAELGRRYTAFEDELDQKHYDETRQLWHTPTELFRPYYGEAIARYMVANYKLSSYPYHDLLIYEMGAGRGTLMLNVLDYIRQADPDVYARTRYKVIEVSTSLASLQAQQLKRSADSRGHADKVSIVNKSIFDWDIYEPSPCFFVAMEVFDNFAHDMIRYDLATDEPLQGVVLIDAHGDFYEFESAQLDPVVRRFLEIRDAACGGRGSDSHRLENDNVTSSSLAPISPSRILESTRRILRRLRSSMPFAPNLSQPEYLPTRLMAFFDVLRDSFPAHKLIASDFHALPQAVPGVNAPVVQTRYQRRMVPVSTPLVHQGYFDILFPTDFGTIDQMYRAMTGKLTQTMSHEEYFRRWAYVQDTQTQSGENPLLSWYKNASVMMTV